MHLILIIIALFRNSCCLPELSIDPNGRYENGKMSGWQIHEYGGVNSLRFSDSIEIPAIRSKYDVVVEVYATSVNPLDQVMTGLSHLNFISI